jgi:hypothetical protein
LATHKDAEGNAEAVTNAPMSPDGAEMLEIVGNFVAPLTRFDRSHLNLLACTSTYVAVRATQTFQPEFTTTAASGVGPLPGDVRDVASANGLQAEVGAMMERAKRTAAERIAAWSDAYGSKPDQPVGTGDVFTSEGRIGYAATCQSCHGAGKTNCLTCGQTGQVRCIQCGGLRKTTCSACSGRGQINCTGCAGQGGHNRQVEKRGWNAADNRQTVTYETVWETCRRCNGARTEPCGRCGHSGKVDCSNCGAKGTTVCTNCHGAGTLTCEACNGHGEQHQTAEIACRMDVNLEIGVAATEETVRAELARLTSVDDILGIASEYEAIPQAYADRLTRVTTAQVAVASATFGIGDASLVLNGYGPDYTIFDYRDIGGALLMGDVQALEAALAQRRNLAPALAGMLESEAHAEIAMRSGAMSKTKRSAALEALSREFRGLASPAYAERASTAIRRGLSRAYFSKLLQWPVFVLALPLAALPVNWLMWRGGVRNQDAPVIFSMMLVTLAAAFLGDRWIGATLQRDLASGGKPKVSNLFAKLGLTRNWMIAAGIAALLLSPLGGALGRVWAGF